MILLLLWAVCGIAATIRRRDLYGDEDGLVPVLSWVGPLVGGLLLGPFALLTLLGQKEERQSLLSGKGGGMKHIESMLFVLAILLASVVPAWAASNVLSWQDNSTNEANFHVERKAEACAGTGAFAEIATVGINVSTFNDTTVTEGVTYCYRVAASNPAGKSAYSNTASRLVPFTAPAAPSGLGVAGGP